MKVKVHKKSRALRSIRNVAISTLVIAMLLVGAAVGYTWYMSRDVKNKQEAKVEEPLKKTSKEDVRHLSIDPNAVVGVSVQMATSVVAPGENASVTVRTNPQARCTISISYDQTKAVDSGLAPKVADDYGMVTWSWTVDPNATIGTWPAKILCSNDSKSGANSAKIQVKK